MAVSATREPSQEGTGGAASTVSRVPELSFFFPAHNEEANLEALVEEALQALPSLADKFEIIAVNDGSKDRTAVIADQLAVAHPDIFRVVHHPTNYGYGAALRSGFDESFFEGNKKAFLIGRAGQKTTGAETPGN